MEYKLELYLSNCTVLFLDMSEAIMTEDDCLSLNEYRTEKKTGKLTSYEELKREMVL